jgi:hypothetical protein
MFMKALLIYLKLRLLKKKKIEATLAYLSGPFVVGMESNFGAPVAGVQSHPEMVFEETELAKLADKAGNTRLFSSFLEAAKTCQLRKTLFFELLECLSISN